MRLQAPMGWQSFLQCALLLTGVWAKDKPEVKAQKFDFIPYNVNYFEDSDVLLFEDIPGSNVYRSEDAGVNWEMVKGGPEGKVVELVMHTYDKKRAYIITNDRTHWKTSDRGKTWDEFRVDAQASLFRQAMDFHAADPDRIIFNAMDCSGIFCEELAMYTTDGFSKEAKFLRGDTIGCHWAKGSELFTTGQPDLDKDRILCVAKGRLSPWRKDYRLLISDNFFQKSGGVVQEFEPELEPGRTVQGIVNMAFVKPYLVVAASAASTDEMALYTSDNATNWHRAIFPQDHKIKEEAYTLLEGTNYSIQIDVMNTRPSRKPMGVFLSSNSNGTYFTRNMDHTNRNMMGLVDFEKMAGIQGIVFVNTVDNWEEVEKSNVEKKVKSQISFDDGRTWVDMKVDKETLHLHSVTDLSNSGRVFSSPAPGLVMGVGNTGKYLGDYKKDGNLYVSDDAGLTWRFALKGPHKYEFGDQGSVLLAVEDRFNNEAKYSLDHGNKWQEVDLPYTVSPVQLTTTPDSTSLKFLLEAKDDGKSGEKAGYIIVIDFNGLHEKQCTDDDMEIWHARVDSEGKPTCLMGHTQSYRRRKPSSDCFLNKEFQDPQVITEICECTDADFECDYNFVRSADRKNCEQAPGTTLLLPDGECKAFGPEDTFQGSSGWRLIAGNNCKRTSGAQKDDDVPRKCSLAAGQPVTGKPGNSQGKVTGVTFEDKIYLERTGVSSGEDETVIMRTENEVFISQDHGKKWEQILKNEKIIGIAAHPYFNDMVFFFTSGTTVWYSTERGRNIRSFKAPFPHNKDGRTLMYFHPKYKDWLIWIGAKDCDSAEGCHTVASVTRDRGDDGWLLIQRYVMKCEFINEVETGYKTPGEKESPESKKQRDKLIYCISRSQERNDDKDNPWKLVSSDDFFEEQTEHFTDVVNFATMSEFIVVARKDVENDSLKVDGSVDGQIFADAKFPYDFVVSHQSAYTVLDSTTHSVFLHVTVEKKGDLQYGTILKSNSNGTSYVRSLDAVNRDGDGYVDFEKMAGIEGVAVANTVANFESKNYEKEGKRIKSLITHNDGAEWDYLSPPKTDAEGRKFACSGSSIDKCSLHIHGYTERAEKSHTYSSKSAIGLMFVTGNVGEFLTSQKDADTFMTTDAGITWKHVMKGTFMWQYGDQGSILVIVKDREATKTVYYSTNEGEKWESYDFSDHELNVLDLTTVPSGTSRNFLLWGKNGKELVTINLDFSGLTDVPCKLDEKDVEGGDYYLWVPKHPKQDDDCLFGHVAQYHRKRLDSNCYNGRMIPHLHDIEKNCSCTRRDFECDYNYQRQTDGSCALVAGLSAPDHSLVCVDETVVEWDDPTGYRRIPISTCEGGQEMDKSIPHPCPGKGEEFNERHGLSALGLFFAIIIPFAIAGGIGYWVWKNWASKFGQIRLGEQSTFDEEAPYIKYPVLVIAGIAAVATAIPVLVSSLWRSASNALGGGRTARFTTRDSFARGRGDYAVVDEDEGELLGEESDEEV